MVTRVPIDRETIIWARERCNLSLDQAANLLKVEFDHLSKIEDGDVLPSATLFRKMAGVYLLPEATLLGAVPANEQPLPKDFRSFDGNRVKLTYETILAVRRVQARQEAIASLAEIDDEIVAPELPIHSLKDDPDQLGASFRRAFGFPIVDQLRQTTPQTFQRWRLMVEDLGVSVYIEPLGRDDSRGVSLFFNPFPAIVIDQNEKSQGARLFTLFHELGHLLIRQTGISNFSPQNRIERFCNRFAAAFLMPREAVEAVFDLSGGKVEPDLDELEFASRKLSVTISQLALRLEHLGYVERGFYAGIARLLKPSPPVKKKDKSGPPWRYAYLSRFGHNLPSYVIGSLDRGQITKVEAARLMDAAPAHIGQLRQTLTKRGLMPSDVD